MSQVIIALDFDSKTKVEQFLDLFEGEKLYVKIGMEMYYQYGPEIVREISERGHDIFLDLKLHDIPNTVERTMRNLAKLNVQMVNVHAAGTVEMMKAARRGMRSDVKVLAVTQLTSTSEEQMHKEQLIPVTLMDSVVHYAKMAQEAGLDGVVCSPLEAKEIHQNTSRDFLCVTPGVRPLNNAAGDQKRVTTPAIAKSLTADYIVVGRPITQADDPKAAYQAIVAEWEQA